MTPAQFIAKWRANPLSEKAGAQAFFLDLCAMLGVEPPNDPDNYCFERGATRTGAGHGWADVWKRGHFGWENKGPGGDLGGALKQLMTYALALDNPPLLVVSNRDITQIHTHFTGTPSETHTLRLDDIGTPENQQKLRWLFTDPEKFRPGRTVQDITADAAGRFANIARSLTNRGHDPEKVAHFLIQCLFCMFAEDIGLLPKRLFERVLEKRGSDTVKLGAALGELFRAMQAGGDFLLEDIAWFNGGLFARIELIELAPGEIDALHAASKMDWSAIEPAILGTLFERGLDPKIRAPLGANYTDPGTIMKLVNPVVVEPLAREWAAARERIGALVGKYHAGGKGSQSALKEAQGLFLGYIERLKNFRVLDPACGSGNFLYLSLRALKDLEHRANLDAEALGLQRQLLIETSPANVLGIEINAYAAELARVTVWIGEIQWMLKNGYDCRRNPILATLDHIEHRDALLNEDGSEAAWPTADVIVGNPPFLGGSRKSSELGREYFDALDRTYSDSVPGFADLVCYWFHKARKQIVASKLQAAGLVATNSIRGGANRVVLDAIVRDTRIFEAWSDEDWVNEGAAVRVSLVGFGPFFGVDRSNRLNGSEVGKIHSDLTTGVGIDLSLAVPLDENALAWAYGSQEKGNFEISAETALELLPAPNPNGKPNSDVIRRSVNAKQIAQRRDSTWVIDFGLDMPNSDAILYEKPYAIVQEQVAPARLAGKDKGQAKRWWLHARPSPKYRAALSSLPRVVVTPCVSKHRLFVFLSPNELADHGLAVIARSDDATFGILHSRFHELWSLRTCTWLGVGNDPRYTPTTCFETFPFPAGLTPRDTAPVASQASPPCMAGQIVAENIAAAARRLNELRENWLNPAEWVAWVITPEEEKAGFPRRPVAKPGHEAELKKRTLTNLYNARPAWLNLAHQELDKAVAAAYDWPDYTPEMPDDEILRRLLALNLQRAAA